MKWVTSPRGFRTKAPPRLAWATTRRPVASTARPWGTLAPKKVRNAPTLDSEPRGSRGARQPALRGVMAMYRERQGRARGTPVGVGHVGRAHAGRSRVEEGR